MGIMLRSYINLLKIKESEYRTAFTLVSKYIEKAELMSFSREYGKEKLLILEKAKLINDRRINSNYFDIIGDYLTKSRCENFIIYDNLESYLNIEQKNIFSLIRDKSCDEKIEIIKNKNINEEELNVTMWDSKTQGQPYLVDLIAIGLIFEKITNGAINIEGEFLKCQYEEAINKLNNLIYFKGNSPLKWTEKNEKNYITMAFMLSMFGSQIPVDTINKDSSKIIDSRLELWRYGLGSKLAPNIIDELYMLTAYINQGIEDYKKSDIDELKSDIINGLAKNRVVCDIKVYEYIMNTKDLDYLNKIKAIMSLCYSQKSLKEYEGSHYDIARELLKNFLLDYGLIELIKDFSILEELFEKYGTEETKRLLEGE